MYFMGKQTNDLQWLLQEVPWLGVNFPETCCQHPRALTCKCVVNTLTLVFLALRYVKSYPCTHQNAFQAIWTALETRTLQSAWTLFALDFFNYIKTLLGSLSTNSKKNQLHSLLCFPSWSQVVICLDWPQLNGNTRHVKVSLLVTRVYRLCSD